MNTLPVTGAATAVLSLALRCIIYTRSIKSPRRDGMPRQMKLTLVAADYPNIAAAIDLDAALAEMLRAYFHDILNQEEHAAHDGKDHDQP